MALILHRSPRTEELLHALLSQLRQSWPSDVLESVPIMVGSRGMERWLRHRLAEGLGVAAGLDFPFPRQALEGGISWLLGENCQARTAFWQTALAADPWQADALALRLIPLLRQRATDERFAAVARYLGYAATPDLEQSPITAREFQFSRQLADTLDRLLHERPGDLANWPQEAPADHAWIADLLAELRRTIAVQDPAARLTRLAQQPPPPGELRVLHVFGMSTLGLGELLRIEQLARHLHIHLYLLTPAAVWWQDVRAPRHARRALQQAGNPEQLAETLQDLATQNPLLAGLGQPSQFLQAKLEQMPYEDREVAALPLPATPPTLLQALQQWVIAAEPPRQAGQLPPWLADQSLQFHSNYGPLRQVEVLRDRLLDLLQRHPEWTPRDILVMTPDVATFAPLVAAVFGRSEPRLPVEIADMGLSSVNPLAEALLSLLNLASERVTASQLIDLLQLAPVRQRFGFELEDLPILREMAQAAAMSWGFDAADRARHHQPETDQNTVRFALERLALGALLPEDGAALVEGPPMALQPCPVGGQERVALLGRWMALLAALHFHSDRLREPRPVAQWRDDILHALAELTETTAKTGFLQAQLVQELEQLAPQDAPCPLPLERSALVRWLNGRFDQPQHGDRPIGGAIQVCALEPMRSVPFEVVALLGMDDGAFPRSSTPPSWDPFAAPRPGERDRRATDRHLLLEALLCAREALLVLWSGRSVTSGKALPAAVPIEELLGVVAHQTGETRDKLVVDQPLQPWSPQAFINGPNCSFSSDMAHAARDLGEIRSGEKEPRLLAWSRQLREPLPAEEEPLRHLAADALASGLINPSQLLLRQRLGLMTASEAKPLPDREPLELEALDTWGVRQRLVDTLAHELAPLEQLRDHPEPWLQEALKAAAGRGELPLQAGGMRLLRGQWELALNALEHARAVPGPLATAGPWSMAMGELSVHGQAPKALETPAGLVLQWLVASANPNGRAQLTAWVQLLLAASTGAPVAAAHVASAGAKSLWLVAPQQQQALAMLNDLTEVWRQGRRQPLALFAKVSPLLAEFIAAGATQAADLTSKDRGKLEEAWSGGYNLPGDQANAEVAQLYRGTELDELLNDPGDFALWALARRVWLPLVKARQEVSAAETPGLVAAPAAGAQESP
jgi:exodeoxyribonuclease V gamma subunit